MRMRPSTRWTLTKGFYMGKYAVTQGEYLALDADQPELFHLDGQ